MTNTTYVHTYLPLSEREAADLPQSNRKSWGTVVSEPIAMKTSYLGEVMYIPPCRRIVAACKGRITKKEDVSPRDILLAELSDTIDAPTRLLLMHDSCRV